MPINLRGGQIKTQLYGVKGNTLTEVYKSMMKNGPTDPNENKRYSGLCECTAELRKSTTELRYMTTPKGAKFYSEATMIKGTMTYKCMIKMPKLAAGKLSKTAMNEWTRFISRVKVHEMGHVKQFSEELKFIIAEIQAIKSCAFGKDAKTAKKAAFNGFAEELNRINITKRLTKNAIIYDRRTGHGKSQKAVLKYDIQ